MIKHLWEHQISSNLTPPLSLFSLRYYQFSRPPKDNKPPVLCEFRSQPRRFYYARNTTLNTCPPGLYKSNRGSILSQLPQVTERMRTVAIILLLTLYVSAAELEPHSSRVRRGTDCKSQTCKDCLESCDGCNKCPLCVLVLPSCNKGNPLAGMSVKNKATLTSNLRFLTTK